MALQYAETREKLEASRDKFGELTGDFDFGNRVIHAFDSTFKAVGDSLQGMRALDVGAGKGAGLIAALLLEAELAVGIDRRFDEFGHDGYANISWIDICSFYNVDHKKTLFIRGEIPHTAFKGYPFDIVYLIDTIEHVPDVNLFINYAVSNLAKGGFLIIETAPLYYSPFGHHLWPYFNNDDSPWAHLSVDFDEKIIEKAVDSWSLEKFRELNKCTYEDVRYSVENNSIQICVDDSPVNESYKLMYDGLIASCDFLKKYPMPLLCRESVYLAGKKI